MPRDLCKARHSGASIIRQHAESWVSCYLSEADVKVREVECSTVPALQERVPTCDGEAKRKFKYLAEEVCFGTWCGGVRFVRVGGQVHGLIVWIRRKR
jgi:hypothetical protein